MARVQPDQEAQAEAVVRDVQRLTRDHREQHALLGEVVDAVTDRTPNGDSVAVLSASLVDELRRRTGRGGGA